MASPIDAFDKAIYDKLTGATALTSLLAGGTANPSVYPAPAPQNANAPYVVYQAASPSVPQRVMGGGGVAYENAVYIVKAVAEGPSAGLAGTIAVQIDAALDNQALTITGYTAMACLREQDIDFPEVEGGITFRHRGGLYRVMADPT